MPEFDPDPLSAPSPSEASGETAGEPATAPEAGEESPEASENTGFGALGLSPELLAALEELGYEEPTPIQREAVGPLLGGRDLLGQAATGTGKTAAFALPLLQRIAGQEAAPGRPRGLVLVPTRELAMQVAEAVRRYGRRNDVHVLPIYGGQPIFRQLRALERGVDIVIATPGRARDHLVRGTLVLDDVAMVVLDEADVMLDMGFAEDLEAILTAAPAERQTALFSATLPARILGIAEQALRDPVRVTIARERTEPGEAPRVRQVAYVVPRSRKDAALARVLDMEAPTSAILFCRTRLEVDELTEAMNARGYRAEALHGGFAQEQRDRVMKRFRTGKTDLLVATDVAARGLDVDHVSHVVNYDVPLDPDDYVHRIGRTGRAGREGVAITFLAPREKRILETIRRSTRQHIPIESVPSASDLETRRLERTRLAVLEALEDNDLDAFRKVVLDLGADHDPVDLAAAALKMAHGARRGEAEGDQEDFEWTPPARQERPDRHESPQRRPQGEWRGGDERGGPRPYRDRERDHGDRDHGRGGPPFERRGGPNRNGPPTLRAQGVDSVRLFIGAGRAANLRPGDLVGAITNEAGVPGSSIGSIQIAERHTVVEVRAEVADAVMHALRNTTLRGRRVNVRPDRY